MAGGSAAAVATQNGSNNEASTDPPQVSVTQKETVLVIEVQRVKATSAS